MSRAARAVLALSAAAVGALLVATLALESILPGWGLLFFYALPSLFVGLWSARELVPARWRSFATPVRRRWRLSPLAASAAPPRIAAAPPPRAARDPHGRPAPIAAAARIWLRFLRPIFSALRSPRGRRIGDVAVVAGGALLLALAAHEVLSAGWPARPLEPTAAAAAAAFFLSMYGLRALGWQRLFRPVERPRSLVLVTGTGTADVASIALPPRIGDAICVSVVRKLGAGRHAPSIGTTALTLFVLGLMDVAAIVPLAIYAVLGIHDPGVRIAMFVVMGVGIGAAGVAAALPSVRTSERLTRRGVGHWLARHAPVSRRDALWAWLLVGASWVSRAAAMLLLLDAIGLGASFSVAAAYVVAGAGASSLPVGPAGAATEAGAGAAVLAGAGLSTSQAIALAVTAQALSVGSGGLLALLGVTLLRRRRRGRLT